MHHRNSVAAWSVNAALVLQTHSWPVKVDGCGVDSKPHIVIGILQHLILEACHFVVAAKSARKHNWKAKTSLGPKSIAQQLIPFAALSRRELNPAIQLECNPRLTTNTVSLLGQYMPWSWDGKSGTNSTVGFCQN